MHIRDFNLNDQKICQLIHIASATAEGFAPNIIQNDFDRNIYKKYISSGGCFKVVESDSKVIGFGGLLKTGPDTFEVMRMRVLKEFQRTGVGTLLLKSLETSTANRKGALLKLDTINLQAKHFYLSQGYELIKETPEGDYRCFYFEKRLGH